MNPVGLTSFRSVITNAGFTIDDVITDLTAAIDPKYKAVFLLLPSVPFTVAEINNLKAFSADGGRIVFIGEHEGFYLAAGISTENTFFQNMGAQMTNSGGAFDCGTYIAEPASRLRPHQVTTGLTQLTIACASEVIPGPNDYPFLYSLDGLHVLAAAAKVDVSPLTAANSLLRPAQRSTNKIPATGSSTGTVISRYPTDTQGRPIKP